MRNSLLATLTSLAAAKVDFVLVGGLAGVLHGAPIHTYDVDIVFSQTPENIVRTLRVLESIDAVFRIQSSCRIKPNESHLKGSGHLNLVTKHGYLNLLTIGDNLRFEHGANTRS